MNFRIYIFFIVILLNFSCQNNCNCKIDDEILRKNDSILNTINSINKKYWDKYLSDLEENDIRFEKKNIYRFSNKDIMSGSTFVYKIEQNVRDYKLTVKKHYKYFDGNDSINIKYERQLTEKEWNKFENQIKNTCFWTLPTRIKRSGLDGSNWLLEAISINKNYCTERNYHAVIRWSPENESEFYKLCQILIGFDKNE
ncbi:hypothetical protein [Flavobacterium okayamense]|uniref:Lipoprotein n=1 Tax=Flavobacterium okayamense TaxID=2830782 RepID=A0ABM7S5K8_9FLAO|nr:hypothetical protein [Flavobacterium okayamense]BCY28787.1 hypothetical protein KK2020170_16550 [Flavobacterium okayamense]